VAFIVLFLKVLLSKFELRQGNNSQLWTSPKFTSWRYGYGRHFGYGDILPEGVSLNIPSFLINEQFTQNEVNNNRFISKARIHVECFI